MGDTDKATKSSYELLLYSRSENLSIHTSQPLVPPVTEH